MQSGGALDNVITKANLIRLLIIIVSSSPRAAASSFPSFLVAGRSTAKLHFNPSVAARQVSSSHRLHTATTGRRLIVSASGSTERGVAGAWGQKKISLNPADWIASSSSSASLEGAAATYKKDLTDDLIKRGIPELSDIKEGIAFFHLKGAIQGSLVLSSSSGLTAEEESSKKVATNILGVPIVNGQLVSPTEEAAEGKKGHPEARIWLMAKASSALPVKEEGEREEEEEEVPSVTVTWNGDKIRTGSSHRCETREGEVSEDRKAALDKALTELGVDIQDLTDEDQVTGSGSSAVRSYFSFVQPRPNKNHNPVDKALDIAANRAANQIAFLIRAYRAEQAEYLRNHDQAMNELVEKGAQMHPMVIVLDNVRSAYNVGSIFRTSETALISEIITCGFTPHPPHAKLEKTACRSVINVPNRHFATTIKAVKHLKSKGYAVFAMETTSRSECYTNVHFPRPVALILGNEVIGVDTNVMALCDKIIEIPTFGQKNSLNVASACPIVVFEALRQWRAFPSISIDSNEAGGS